jgi:hypothetical protein
VLHVCAGVLVWKMVVGTMGLAALVGSGWVHVEFLLKACEMGEVSVLDLVEGYFPARLVARFYSHDDTIRIRSVGSGMILPQPTQPWQSLSASTFLALLSDASKSQNQLLSNTTASCLMINIEAETPRPKTVKGWWTVRRRRRGLGIESGRSLEECVLRYILGSGLGGQCWTASV